jgi:hypothetical protein
MSEKPKATAEETKTPDEFPKLKNAAELASERGSIDRQRQHGGKWYRLEDLPDYAGESDEAFAEAVTEYESRESERDKYIKVLAGANFDDLKLLGFERLQDILDLSGAEAYKVLSKLQKLEQDRAANKDTADKTAEETKQPDDEESTKSSEKSTDSKGEAKDTSETAEAIEVEAEVRFLELFAKWEADILGKRVGEGNVYKDKEEAKEMIDRVLRRAMEKRGLALNKADSADKPSKDKDKEPEGKKKDTDTKDKDTEGGGKNKTKKGSEADSTTTDAEKKEKEKQLAEFKGVLMGKARNVLEKVAARKDLDLLSPDERHEMISKAIKNAVEKPADMSQEDYDKLVKQAIETKGDSESELDKKQDKELAERLEGKTLNGKIRAIKKVLKGRRQNRAMDWRNLDYRLGVLKDEVRTGKFTSGSWQTLSESTDALKRAETDDQRAELQAKIDNAHTQLKETSPAYVHYRSQQENWEPIIRHQDERIEELQAQLDQLKERRKQKTLGRRFLDVFSRKVDLDIPDEKDDKKKSEEEKATP